MSKTQQLQAAIADLQAQLHDAEQRHHQTAATLANDPTRTEMRDRARATQQVVADIKHDIALLEDARGAAAADDASAAATVRKREAAEHYQIAVELLAVRRPAAAKKLDEALATLKKACEMWSLVNSDVVAHVRAFHRVVLRDTPPAHKDMLGLKFSSPERWAVNGLLTQLQAAIAAAGVPAGHVEFHGIVTYGNNTESVAADLVRHTAGLLGSLQGTAEANDIPTK